MLGLLGKKLGMTSIFGDEGKAIACTIVEAGPCYVTQVKTDDTDGYTATQIGFGAKKEKSTTAPLKGHFAKAGVSPLKKVLEIRDLDVEANLGDVLTLDMFTEGDKVNVVGQSKGKGYQGVVRRHNFKGVGMGTHGQHNRERAPGSLGTASTSSRVFKNMRMSGRMGNDRVKVKNLEILKIYQDRNIVLIKGAVPGCIGSFVIIEK